MSNDDSSKLSISVLSLFETLSSINRLKKPALRLCRSFYRRKKSHNTFNVFAELPRDVYYLLASFLRRRDFISLLLSNKQYFHPIYRAIPRFLMDENVSARFLLDPPFRASLYDRLTSQQLGISIYGYQHSSTCKLTELFASLLTEGSTEERRSLFLLRCYQLKLVRLDSEAMIRLLTSLRECARDIKHDVPQRGFIPVLYLKQITPAREIPLPAMPPLLVEQLEADASPLGSAHLSFGQSQNLQTHEHHRKGLTIPRALVEMFQELVIEEMSGLNLALDSIAKISLKKCHWIQSINQQVLQDHPRIWHFSDCSFQEGFPSFQHLHQLTLVDCPQLSTAHPLRCIYSLHIEYHYKHTFQLQQYEWSHLTIVKFVGCRFVSNHPSFLLDCQRATFHACTINSNWNLFKNPARVNLLFENERFGTLPDSDSTAKIALWSMNNCLFEFATDKEIEHFFRNIGSIPSVSILNGLSIKSIGGLGASNIQVTISACHQVTDFSCLSEVPYLHIINCNGFTNVAQFKNVKNLVIERCDGITSVSSLGRLESLEIVDCFELHALDQPQTIPILKIRYCPNLYLLGLVTVTERLEIISCPKLRTIVTFHHIPSVYIEDCSCFLIPSENR